MLLHVKFHLLHKEFHLDEGFCDWVRRRHGTGKYPGSDTAEILIEGAAGHQLGQSVAALQVEGIEAFGRWGGQFDEHSPATPDKCAADLVTEDLGLTGHVAISKILDFVHKTDLGPSAHQLDTSSLVKLMHAAHQTDPMKVMKWIHEALDAKYEELMMASIGNKLPLWKPTPNLAKEFLDVPESPALQGVMKFAREDNHPFGLGRVASAIRAMDKDGEARAIEWARAGLSAVYQDQQTFQEARNLVKRARWERFVCRGKEVSIVLAHTENRKFAAAARAVNAAVVIVRQPSGNVQIYPNQNVNKLGFRVNMNKVAAAIRLAEQNRKGKAITTNQEALEAEGMVVGAEEWHYTGEKKGQFLLNGSSTAENDPTKLDDNALIRLVKNYLLVF